MALKMIHYLGNDKPAELQVVEMKILNQVWKIAQGEATAEEALKDLLCSFNFNAKDMDEATMNSLQPGWFMISMYQCYSTAYW